ncbi:hypothetical protein ACP4OV_020112 [Aristida adscensionis]
MECHLKAQYAGRSLGQEREFNIRLSPDHLKAMVEGHYNSKDGAKLKGRQKLEICLKMAQRHGILSEEDYNTGRLNDPKVARYRIQAYQPMKDHHKKKIPSLLDKGEILLSSFRVSQEYLAILPQEIYRYRAPEKNTVTARHDVHCVVLTGNGIVEKECVGRHNFESEIYYEYLNSYSHGWGVDGFGFIYADSLHQTFRLDVRC